MPESAAVSFVGVREFKEKLTGRHYETRLNLGGER